MLLLYLAVSIKSIDVVRNAAKNSTHMARYKCLTIIMVFIIIPITAP